MLARLGAIPLESRTPMIGNVAGRHRSPHRGSSVEFAEYRKYVPGDDTRRLDWKAYARSDRYYIKEFEADTNLRAYFVVDSSGSMNFSSGDHPTKIDFARKIAATLSFSAMQNNDKVGLILFSDQVELFIPPKKGRSHVLRIIRELLEYQPKSQKTSISNALEFLSGVLKKKAIVFIMSDFMDSGYEKTLRIVAKKHDLTGIRIYDRHEETMPNIGLVPMLDNETGQTAWVNTQSTAVRKAYAEQYRTMVGEFENLFHKNGAGTLHSRLDESYVKKLLNYFKSRG